MPILVKNVIYALSGGYVADISDYNFSLTLKNEELVELRDHGTEGNGDVLTSQVNSGVKEVHTGGEKKLTLFERIEFLISAAVRGIANALVRQTNGALNWVDGASMNETIAIDTIIFDDYPLTKLSLFTSDLADGEQRSDFVESFAEND